MTAHFLRLTTPSSRQEASRRRVLFLNMLLVLIICLAVSGLLIGLGKTFYLLTHDSGLSPPRLFWQSASIVDVLTFGGVLLIITAVALLANREINNLLKAAHESETRLLCERSQLERKVRQRTKQLEKAQVEKMLELHRFAEFGRFSSMLLHDLTNPLTAIAINLEELEAADHQLLEQARQGMHYIEEYVEAARRQLRNQSEIKTFEVQQEIERVIGLLESKARARDIKLVGKFERGLTLHGDSIRFDQVMANLIANAIDAYEGVNRVRKYVLIESAQRSGKVEITVQDKGSGIPPKMQRRIFDPFYTTKSHKRGTGLGLTITKQIIEESFAGTVNVTSSQKLGTSFQLRLPNAG